MFRQDYKINRIFLPLKRHCVFTASFRIRENNQVNPVNPFPEKTGKVKNPSKGIYVKA
jgi:hypothetical protein